MRKRNGMKWTALIVAAAAAFVWSERDAIGEHVWAAKESEEGASAAGEAGMSAEAKLESELAAGFASHESRFDVSYRGDRDRLADDLPDYIRKALAADDYIRYSMASYVYTIRSLGNHSTIHVEAQYRETKEQSEAVTAEVRQILADILKPGMNDHQKIKAIHDYVVTHVEYDTGLTQYTAYDALFNGKAVCQGYSLLGYRLLTEAGITARIAEGTVNSGEHAWNMVLLDGNWYHLDLTWDDPVISGGAKDDGRIRYAYYLRTDEELRQDHAWTLVYPAANTRYADTLKSLIASGSEEEQTSYAALQQQLGLQWLEADYTVSGAKELAAKLQQAVQEKQTTLQFRYTQGDTFAADLKTAFAGLNKPLGYSAQYEPYGNDGSMLVTLEITLA